MSKSNVISNTCPMDIGLNLLSGKWKLSILWHLSIHTLRFNELKRKLGTISQKSLSLQLHELEEAGLISRKSYNEVPPRVEYSLTELGKKSSPVFSALCDFGNEYKNKVADATLFSAGSNFVSHAKGSKSKIRG